MMMTEAKAKLVLFDKHFAYLTWWFLQVVPVAG